VFSSRSWEADATFNVTEDLLHSIAATVMGFAFAVGAAAVGLRTPRSPATGQLVVHVAAVAAAILIPLGMVMFPSADGLLQRAMFAIAYAWFGAQAFLLSRVRAERGSTTA
jgi:hypothetical protein